MMRPERAPVRSGHSGQPLTYDISIEMAKESRLKDMVAWTLTAFDLFQHSADVLFMVDPEVIPSALAVECDRRIF